jgi:hypothetical protein
MLRLVFPLTSHAPLDPLAAQAGSRCDPLAIPLAVPLDPLELEQVKRHPA